MTGFVGGGSTTEFAVRVGFSSKCDRDVDGKLYKKKNEKIKNKRDSAVGTISRKTAEIAVARMPN